MSELTFKVCRQIIREFARSPGNLASRTTMLLQGTTSYFDRIQRVGNRRTLATEASPSSSYLTKRSRRRFGIAPWHRRHSQDSLLSVSSSVHKLLMGKTPIATPSAEKHYVGPDGKTYPTGTYNWLKTNNTKLTLSRSTNSKP